MVTKKTLPNGLRILTIPQKGTQAVTVLVLVNTGSHFETKKVNGISHFLEHLLFKGTEKRPNHLAISEPLDRVGGMYNAFTGEEYTGYYAKVGTKHFSLALDILSDIYLNSTLPPQEIAKEKGVIVEEINMYYDNPATHVQNLWNEALYGSEQPAGWKISGTKETVLGIERAQLAQYQKKQYVASNTVVCVAGNLPENEQQTSKLVAQYFAALKKTHPKKKTKVTTPAATKKSACLLEARTTDQVHLCLGMPAYDLFHKHYYTQEVLSCLLGGMMSSRLFVKIREELGIAYYIRTAASAYTDSGYLVTAAGVETKNAARAIEEILAEYAQVAATKVPAPELKKAKEHIKGSMALSLETSDALASFYGAQELLRRKLFEPKEIFAIIDTIDTSAIQQAARNLFQPAHMRLSIVGPFTKKDKTSFEKLLRS